MHEALIDTVRAELKQFGAQLCNDVRKELRSLRESRGGDLLQRPSSYKGVNKGGVREWWSRRSIRGFYAEECEQEVAAFHGTGDARASAMPRMTRAFPSLHSAAAARGKWQRVSDGRPPQPPMRPPDVAADDHRGREPVAQPPEACPIQLQLPGAMGGADEGAGSDDGLRNAGRAHTLTPVEPFAVEPDWRTSSRSSEPCVPGAAPPPAMRGPPHFKGRPTVKNDVQNMVKSAMGLSGALGTSHPGTQGRPRLESVVHSMAFERLMMVLILANCVTVGTQIDYVISHQLTMAPTFYRALDIVFCAAFALEVALRMHVHRVRFFSMWGWGWNAMDLVLVVVQIVEEIMISELDASAPSGAALRIIGMLRCVRIIRILRVMRFAEELRLLVMCILFSMKSFVSALVFLFLVISIYGVYLTQSVDIYRIDHDPDDAGSQELMVWYGSIMRASLSLFQALTGGVSWNDIVQPLIKHLDPAWGLSFVVWMAFATLAVLNIITSLFVQSAIEQASKEKERNRVIRARKLFECLDLDDSGCIGREEIEKHLDSPAVRDVFREVDVATSEAKCVFDLLDCSGDGYIDFEEFLSGCVRLQGQAKALDMILLVLDTRQGFDAQAAMMVDVVSQVRELVQATKLQQRCTPDGAQAASCSHEL